MSTKRFIVLDLEEAMIVRTALRTQQKWINARLRPDDCREFREVMERVSNRIDANFKAHGIKLGLRPTEEGAA